MAKIPHSLRDSSGFVSLPLIQEDHSLDHKMYIKANVVDFVLKCVNAFSKARAGNEMQTQASRTREFGQCGSFSHKACELQILLYIGVCVIHKAGQETNSHGFFFI